MVMVFWCCLSRDWGPGPGLVCWIAHRGLLVLLRDWGAQPSPGPHLGQHTPGFTSRQPARGEHHPGLHMGTLSPTWGSQSEARGGTYPHPPRSSLPNTSRGVLGAILRSLDFDRQPAPTKGPQKRPCGGGKYFFEFCGLEPLWAHSPRLSDEI